MGLHQHPIATQSEEAQKFFNQGLILYYGFNRYEAQRSFRRAAELDPKAPMPLWGLALTYAPHLNMDLDGDVDLNKGCGFARKAARLEANAKEGAYVKAALAMCESEQAYRAALGALYRTFADDPDAATLYAESLMVPVRWRWWKDGRPEGAMAECIRILEQVLKRDPDHPGANHFYVHAMEMSPNPEYALPSAQRLMGGVAPNAGHLVHMAGHIYLRLGDYEVVAGSNERAISADEHYFHQTNVQSGYIGYYAHNIHFLVYARMMQGRFDEAFEAARKMTGVLGPMVAEMPALLDPFIPTELFVLTRFQQWDRILATPPPAEKLPVARSIWRWARAVALWGKRQRAEALRERDAFEAARRAVPAGAIWINNKAADVLDVAAAVLAARLAASDAEAIAHWEKAVALQDQLVYDEPPPWFYPVRESLGAACLRAGDARRAEAAFRADLERNPRNPRSLFGLYRTLEAQQRAFDAQWVKLEFERAWRRAQAPLDLNQY